MSQLFIPLGKIKPNPLQPRTVFDEASLQELADSIAAQGLIQPILVEAAPDGDYVLISGERRLRAHVLLGKSDIAAFVRPKSEASQNLIAAMLENIARDDMNPVDEANGYKRLRDEFGMTARKISKETGIRESRIYHLLKVADLEPEIQECIKNGTLPIGVEAVKALHDIPTEQRVQFALALSRRRPTIAVVVGACQKYNELAEVEKLPRKTNAPAEAFAGTPVELPEWDALYQLGKVPPWPVMNNSLMGTCDACSMRSIASPAVCGPCPLVAFMRRILLEAKTR